MSGVPKLETSLARARALGCRVELVKGTGEVRVVCPCGARRATLNNRKKDSPRILLLLLKHAVDD